MQKRIGGLLAFWPVQDSQLVGVVRVASVALVSQPVVLYRGFGGAIVALDDSSRVGKLLGHRLTLNGLRELLPLEFHVDGAFLARGALVRSFHVLVIASFMQIMPTWHGHNGGRRVEQIFAAYRAVAVGRAFDALVG